MRAAYVKHAIYFIKLERLYKLFLRADKASFDIPVVDRPYNRGLIRGHKNGNRDIIFLFPGKVVFLGIKNSIRKVKDNPVRGNEKPLGRFSLTVIQAQEA